MFSNMQKNLLTLFSAFTFTLLTTIGFAQGTFDVRFLIDSVDCTNIFRRPKLSLFLQQKCARQSATRSGIGCCGIYSRRSRSYGICLLLYNLELQGGDGLYVTDTDYFNVGRLSLDILDFNTPVCLRWHRDIPADFPNTFVGQKLNGSLVPTDEGSYLDYYQDLSIACSNSTPTAVDDTGTTPEEQPITVCLPTNDTDPENALDNMSVTLINTPPASEGTVTLNATTGCIRRATTCMYDCDSQSHSYECQ